MDRKTIISYLNGQCDADTARRIEQWAESSPANRKTFEALDYLHNVAIATYDEKSTGKGNVRTLTRNLRAVAAVLVAGVMIGWAVSRYLSGSESMQADYMAVHASAGQRVDLTLSDGTRVWLNSEATLHYPARFSPGQRRVILNGEAMFEVEHDRDREFVVETYAGDISVLGTKFNVEADEIHGLFSTALFEGSIELSALGRSVRMEPNDRVSIRDGKLIMDRIDGQSDYRWVEGIVNLDGLDFAQCMLKLEKAFGIHIIMKKDYADKRIDMGKIMTADGIDKALKILQYAVKFNYEIDVENNAVVIR